MVIWATIGKTIDTYGLDMVEKKSKALNELNLFFGKLIVIK